MLYIKVESRSDDPVSLGHFFGGSHLQTKLSGCYPDVSYISQLLLKRKLQHVGHSYMGHIQIVLWVSGSTGDPLSTLLYSIANCILNILIPLASLCS